MTESKQGLFFRNRVPIWRDKNLSPKWQRPSEGIEVLLKENDFITLEDIKDTALEKSSMFQEDLVDLKTWLIDPYFRSNQLARYYQNLYFRFQWIMVMSAFATALVATLVVVFNPAPIGTANSLFATDTAATASNLPPTNVSGTPAINADSTIARIFAVITAIATGVTSYYTFKAQRQKPQYMWYSWRRVTEDFRRHYYLYLAHLPPYDKEDRVDVLQDNMAKIENSGAVVSDVQPQK